MRKHHSRRTGEGLHVLLKMVVVVMRMGMPPRICSRNRESGRFVQLADVFLEIKVPTEALAADPARKGFLVVVRVHVEGQVVDLVEGLVAYRALVGLLAAVRQ